MSSPGSRDRLKILLLVGGLSLAGVLPVECLAAGYGNLAGIVSDSKGVPLMGATVTVLGPTAFAAEAGNELAERMITDAHGRFTIAHLVPGWYSLKVSSPARLPAMRNGVRVDAGATVVATFVLADVLAPIRFQMPSNSVSSWGDDWKWVLRTSSNTRPILRLHEQKPAKASKSPDEKADKVPLSPAEYVAGILPGSTPHDPLAEDFGMASVFAFLRPITPDSDVLTAASFAPFGAAQGTVGAEMIRNQLQGTPQSFGVVYHQFNLVPGASAAPGTSPNAFSQAKGLSATYSDTRLIAPKITVTAGMDVNYLSGVESVFIAQPRVNLEYQATTQTMVSVQYGYAHDDGSNSMMERLSLLNAFPQITESDGRLAMEQLNHAEVALNHRIGKSARVQAAAYHDNLRNAAVWGWGASANAAAFAGNALPNPAGQGLVMNGGSYQSSGFRAIYAQTFGSHLEAVGFGGSGRILCGYGYTSDGPAGGAPPTRFSGCDARMVGAKITAQLPLTHTRISTSYERVPANSVTMVDPAAQGELQVMPYLSMQIRQPLPTPADWPVRIDAVADFQNMLSQGLTATPSGQKSLVLSPSYHYVRGGLAVEF